MERKYEQKKKNINVENEELQQQQQQHCEELFSRIIPLT